MNSFLQDYCSFERRILIGVLFGLFLLINPLLVKSSQARPLTLTQIKQLIKTKTPDGLVTNVIKKRGLAFKPYKDVINELRDSGAGPQTIQELRRLEPLLEEAKRDIPGIINKIFSALSKGEPDTVKGYFSSDIYNSKTLDAICQPFCKQTHYIESIAERPGNKYDVRLRVLFQSVGERAYFFVFQSTQDSYVLESMYDLISGYSDGYGFFGAPQDIVNDWFGSWKDKAQEIVRKFFYALKDNKTNMVKTLCSSPDLIPTDINIICENIKADNRDIVGSFKSCFHGWLGNDLMDNLSTKIVSHKGIKAEVSFSYQVVSGGYSITWVFFVDKINGNYKIVQWYVGDGVNNPTKYANYSDPKMELRTLKRFGAATPGDQAKVKAMEAMLNVKIDEIHGVIYNYTEKEYGKYLIKEDGDKPQMYPKIRNLIFGFDRDGSHHDIRFNWDGSYFISGGKMCFNIQNLQIIFVTYRLLYSNQKKTINLLDYSNSQDITSDYKDIGLGYYVKLQNATFENGANEGILFLYRTTQPVPNEIQGCIKITPSDDTTATSNSHTGPAKVYLKNGTVLEGNIEETSATDIKLKTSYGLLNIKPGDVKTIEYENPAQQQSSNTTN